MFAPEDAIPASVKAFLDFEAKLLEPFPKAERAKMKLTDIAGAHRPKPPLPMGAAAKLCQAVCSIVLDLCSIVLDLCCVGGIMAGDMCLRLCCVGRIMAGDVCLALVAGF